MSHLPAQLNLAIDPVIYLSESLFREIHLDHLFFLQTVKNEC